MLSTFWILFLSLPSGDAESWRNVLKEAAGSIEYRTGYSYHFHRYGEGPLNAQFPEIRGKAAMIHDNSGGLKRAWIRRDDETDVVIKERIVYRVVKGQKRILRAPLYRNGTDLFDEMLLAPHFLLKELKAAVNEGIFKGEVQHAGKSCLAIDYAGEVLNFTFLIDPSKRLLAKISATSEKFGNQYIHFEMTDVSTKPLPESGFELPQDYRIEEYSGSYPAIGEPAPDFNLTTFQGERINLSELRGKVVVLDFWATWCRPCLQAMPHLQNLHDQYRERVAILGMNHEESGDPVKFLKRQRFTYPNGPGDAIAKRYHVNGLPFVFVIDPKGKVHEFFSGYYGEESDRLLEQTILSLIEP